MKIKTFLLVPTYRCEVSLRIYGGDKCACSPVNGIHDNETPIGALSAVAARQLNENPPPRSDPRWPTHCKCDVAFTREHRAVWTERIYKRQDTGEEMTLRAAPPGAISRAPWGECDPDFCGEDGKSYQCIIPAKPDGSGKSTWHMDGPASNCNRKGEKHKCWCRHGVAPNFHVDKTGNTCSAGAGSILCHEGWHGYLHDGYLVTC